MKSNTTFNCLHCRKKHACDPRNRGRQCYCGKPECRRASKADSQRRWAGKPENENYFRGAENIERVRQWRKDPGYWRRKKFGKQDALQDLCTGQGAGNKEVVGLRVPDALQDLCRSQPALLVGIISMMLTFYSLSPQAEHYHQQLSARSLNARVHINKIVALADIYGADKVARAIDDAIASEAFASQYIENILQQRERHTPRPGPLHLTRRSDLLDLELSPADLSLYDKP